MKKVYAVLVKFEYSWRHRGHNHESSYWVEAGSLETAVGLGRRLAAREHRNAHRDGLRDGFAPRLMSVSEVGTIEAR